MESFTNSDIYFWSGRVTFRPDCQRTCQSTARVTDVAELAIGLSLETTPETASTWLRLRLAMRVRFGL